MQDIQYHIPEGLSSTKFDQKIEVVTTSARLTYILEKLAASGETHALDFETTSLRPTDGEVRITSIYGPCGFFVIDHFMAGRFADVAEDMALASDYCVFNVGFEGRWFDHYSPDDADLYDIQHLRKAKMGGGAAGGLADVVLKELKVELDKTLQNSDWGRENLSAEQYVYAGSDAFYTYKVWEKWKKELTPQQWGGFLVMNSSWRGVAEMEDTGLPLDISYHRKMIDLWQLKSDTARRYLRKYALPSMIDNLNSRQQCGKFIKEQILTDADYKAWPKTAKAQQMDLSRDVLKQAAFRVGYPASRWLAALIVYNYYNKYLSTYGEPFIIAQEKYGFVKSRTNIAAAITGRLSTSTLSIQNIPKSPVVRRSFVADAERPTSGDGSPYRLVMADYSSIEVRVLAEISKDQALIEEAIYGDVHAASAAARLKMDSKQFKLILDNKKHQLYPAYKAMRSKAKAITFSVCYGSGIANLAMGLKCSDEEAGQAMEDWALRYPKAFGYRQVMFEKLTRTGFIELVDGRSIYVFKDERTLPVASNYGIQGAAASVMYRAIYHTQRLLAAKDLRARMAATIHDELIIRSRHEDAEEVRELLEHSMRLGWLDIFPGSNTDNLADAGVGYSWAEKA